MADDVVDVARVNGPQVTRPAERIVNLPTNGLLPMSLMLPMTTTMC